MTPAQWIDLLLRWIRRRFSRVETPGRPTLTFLESTSVDTIKIKFTREAPADPTKTPTPQGVYSIGTGPEVVIAVAPDPKDPTVLVGEIDAAETDTGFAWERNLNQFGRALDGPKVAFKAADFVPLPEMPGTPTLSFLDDVPEAPPVAAP